MLSIRFPFFLLSRNCKRLREYEEIEISSKAVEVTYKKKTLKTFVWILSKTFDSAKVLFNLLM
jgi:hypothetical protein